MNIKRKSKGTPEQMLQAFENKINELEDAGSIESATSIESSESWAQVDLNAEDEYKYSGNGGRSWVPINSDKVDTWPSKEAAIENGKSTFKPNYKYGIDWDVENIGTVESATHLDESDNYIDGSDNIFKSGDRVIDLDTENLGNVIHFDAETNEYLVSFDNGNEGWVHIGDLALVDNTVESSTVITSADEVDDKEYLEKLCEYVTINLDDAGYEATAYIKDGYLVIESMYDADSQFIQDIEEIEPNWDDLDSDAQELSDAYIEKYTDPTYSQSEDDEY